MRMLLPLLALGSLGACKDKNASDTGAFTDELHVMRNCEPADGRICPWAGDGYNGFNGEGVDMLDAWFSFPLSATFSPYGPVAIADWNNHKIRMVESDGTLTTIMGTDFLGDGDPGKTDSTAAGAPGTTVSLNHPTQQSYFSDGTLVSASWHTHKIRTWDPATGLVHVIVGGAPGFGADDEALGDCKMNQPKEIAVDSSDNLYLLDMRNERVRYLDFATDSATTLAGNGEKDYCGDGGPAVDACFAFPKNANPEPGGALALDEAGGKLYIADTENHVVRVLDLNTGMIDLLAGTPMQTGDVDGPGAQAMFNWPADLALDGTTLFVADSNNHKIRAIDTTTGEVSTFAGTGAATCPFDGDVAVPQVCDEQHTGGDGGPAVDATLYRPFGVDLDLDGNVVIADSYDHRFRIVYR